MEQQKVKAKLTSDLEAEFSSPDECLIVLARLASLDLYLRAAAHLRQRFRPGQALKDRKLYRSHEYDREFFRILDQTPLSDGRTLREGIKGKVLRL